MISTQQVHIECRLPKNIVQQTGAWCMNSLVIGLQVLIHVLVQIVLIFLRFHTTAQFLITFWFIWNEYQRAYVWLLSSLSSSLLSVDSFPKHISDHIFHTSYTFVHTPSMPKWGPISQMGAIFAVWHEWQRAFVVMNCP